MPNNPTEPKGIDSPKLSMFPPLPPPVPDWKEVVDAIQNTEYAIGHIRAHMQALTEGERRSLFRAVLDVDAKVGTPEGIGGEAEPLTRIDGTPTEYAICECGIRIVRVKDDYWADASNGREVCTKNHWHKAKNPTPEPLGEPCGEEVSDEDDAYGIPEDRQCVCFGSPGCEICGGSGDIDDALKVCPFCGSSPRWGESPDGGHFIECSKCQASTNLTYYVMDDASLDVRKRWNKRAKPLPKSEEGESAPDAFSRGWQEGVRYAIFDETGVQLESVIDAPPYMAPKKPSTEEEEGG